MSRPRVRVPRKIKKGDTVTIKTLIAHKMETGVRRNKKTGKLIPRKIINGFEAKIDGATVFKAALHPAVSATRISRLRSARRRAAPSNSSGPKTAARRLPNRRSSRSPDGASGTPPDNDNRQETFMLRKLIAAAVFAAFAAGARVRRCRRRQAGKTLGAGRGPGQGAEGPSAGLSGLRLLVPDSEDPAVAGRRFRKPGLPVGRTGN